jgi:hypothetical protein
VGFSHHMLTILQKKDEIQEKKDQMMDFLQRFR